MSEEAHIHHPDYVKIWAVLVVLLIISVLGPMTGVRSLILITAFGIALVKAYLVAKNFMHVNLERKWVGYLLVVCLLLVVVLFTGVAPDVMRHEGMHWNNTSAKQSVQTGLNKTPAKQE